MGYQEHNVGTVSLEYKKQSFFISTFPITFLQQWFHALKLLLQTFHLSSLPAFALTSQSFQAPAL